MMCYRICGGENVDGGVVTAINATNETHPNPNWSGHFRCLELTVYRIWDGWIQHSTTWSFINNNDIITFVLPHYYLPSLAHHPQPYFPMLTLEISHSFRQIISNILSLLPVTKHFLPEPEWRGPFVFSSETMGTGYVAWRPWNIQ